MVGDIHLRADSVSKVVIEFGMEDIVNTIRREDAALVGDTGAFATGAEGIFKAMGDLEIAIGLGGIVKIAADDDG